MKRFILLFLVSIGQIPVYSQQTVRFFNIAFQQGDLLFVGAKREDLSGAINRVTQREENTAFDHVALVEVCDGMVYLIHATGEKGTIREPLHHYLRRRLPEKPALSIFRLKDDHQPCIPDAINEAKKWLGRPYNWSYVLNDSSIYCSDLLERAFRSCNLFKLEPMTFKNPETDAFDAYWIRYYGQLGIPVPEGQPGCNPNGLAASDRLLFVGHLDPDVGQLMGQGH